MTRRLVGTVIYAIEVPDNESPDSTDNFVLRHLGLAGERMRDGCVLGFAAFDDHGSLKRKVVYGEPSEEMVKLMDEEFEEDVEGVPA